MGKMTNEDFAQWALLPMHVLHKHFTWAFKPAPGSSQQCVVEFDDLLQEANIALVTAWNDYDSKHPSGATFKTYAYTAIRVAIMTYLSSKGVRKRMPTTDDLDEVPTPEDSDTDNTIEREFLDSCIAKLKEHLTRKQYKILIMRHRGKHFEEIGQALGCSRVHARQVYQKLLIKAAEILNDEAQEG